MAIASFSRFDTYKNLLLSLTQPLEEHELLSEKFLLEKDEKKKIDIYYAPFEHINENAKIVLAGITPGLHQMKISYSTILELKDKGLSDEEMLHQVKKNSSFEGPMRKNLISMLDEMGLQNYLGIPSTSDLFQNASHLVQTTSVITYPVFYKGKNYSGSTPNLLKTEMLKKYVLENFAKELESLSNCLIIPLGVNVSNVMKYLEEKDYIHSNAVLYGFPHPSGGNGHRFKQFAENKANMEQAIQSFFR